MGMFEASDYEFIDGASPLIGAMLDKTCDNEKEAKVTILFTMYVERLGYFGKDYGVTG